MSLPALPREIWNKILKTRMDLMYLDFIAQTPTHAFVNGDVVYKVQAAWRAIGSPNLYADRVAELLECHTAWYTYYM